MIASNYLQVDEEKLQKMIEFCWSDFEHPLLAVSVSYKLPGSNLFSSGFLMITCGAHYIFKNKVIGHIELVTTFSLFDVKTMFCNNEQISFEMEKGTITFKSRDSSRIAYMSVNVIKSVTYGNEKLNYKDIMNVVSPAFSDIAMDKRPEHAFVHRAIFFAHHYAKKKKPSAIFESLNSWERRNSHILTLPRTLNPDDYATSVGHAISWEPTIDTLVFQKFNVKSFSAMFDIILENSQKISNLVFTDYSNDDSIPNFSGKIIEKTSISNICFSRVTSPIVLHFFKHCNRISGIESIILSQVKFLSDEFINLSEYIIQNQKLKQSLKKFEFSKCPILNFPIKQFTMMLASFSSLECISLKGLNGDGMRFLNSVSRSNAPVKIIYANFLNFRKNLESVKLPETLLLLDVSRSNFTNEAFATFFICLTKKQFKLPLSLKMNNIKYSKGSFTSLQEILKTKVNQIFPNIIEFELSNVILPADDSRSLFAFLFTQKYLRNLSLGRIQTNNQVEFLKNVMTLVLSLKIPGLELFGSFNGPTIYQFIQALAAQNISFIRHFGIPKSSIGNEGIKVLINLIMNSPNINELMIDGLDPESPDALYQLWQVISSRDSIVSLDYPASDIKKISLDYSSLPQAGQEIVNKITTLCKPSTLWKRTLFNIDELAKGGPMTINGNIFQLCDKEKQTNLLLEELKVKKNHEAKADNNNDSNQHEESHESRLDGFGIVNNDINACDESVDDLLDIKDYSSNASPNNFPKSYSNNNIYSNSRNNTNSNNGLNAQPTNSMSNSANNLFQDNFNTNSNNAFQNPPPPPSQNIVDDLLDF